jgi:hypothetical protein
MHQKAERWSRTHGSRFDLGKYQLVHLTRELGEYNTKQPLIHVEHNNPAVLLSALSYHRLGPTPYVGTARQYVKGKAKTTLQTLQTIAGSTWGSSLMVLKQIYQSIVIPQLAYRCSV